MQFEHIDVNAQGAHILRYGFERGRSLADAYGEKYVQHMAIVGGRLQQSRTVTVPQLLGLVERAFRLKDRYRGRGRDSAAVNLDRLRDYARNRLNSDQGLTLRTFLDMLRRDIMNDKETRDAAEQEAQGPGP